MDDVITGCDNVSTALVAQDQLPKLMNAGNSSSKSLHLIVVSFLITFQLDFVSAESLFNIDQFVKGIQWNPVTDQMSYKVLFTDNVAFVTKRQFLSDAARLYDPLGWIAPVVILVKVLFQELWQSKIDCDDRLLVNLHKQWDDLRQSFT